jgi:hypothetical protein
MLVINLEKKAMNVRENYFKQKLIGGANYNSIKSTT